MDSSRSRLTTSRQLTEIFRRRLAERHLAEGLI